MLVIVDHNASELAMVSLVGLNSLRMTREVAEKSIMKDTTAVNTIIIVSVIGLANRNSRHVFGDSFFSLTGSWSSGGISSKVLASFQKFKSVILRFSPIIGHVLLVRLYLESVRNLSYLVSKHVDRSGWIHCASTERRVVHILP